MKSLLAALIKTEHWSICISSSFQAHCRTEGCSQKYQHLRHVMFYVPPPPPFSPPLPQWAVLWSYVRFLRQYHSTVHRETTAVQNYTGLPRTLHPAQVGHWRRLDFLFSISFFLSLRLFGFLFSKLVCCCCFLLLHDNQTFTSGSNEGEKDSDAT